MEDSELKQSTTNSLDEFRRAAKENQDGKIITLPSGMNIKLRRPSIARLIKEQKIPQNLIAAAIRVVSGANTISAEDLSENVSLMENLLLLSIVEPVGFTLEDVQNMDDTDKETCYLYIQKGAIGLKSFRNQLLQQAARLDM